MKKELILSGDPNSPVSEIFRSLRTNIQFMDGRRSSNTILITSTLPGEGKSWISSNLAIAFAQNNKNVLLIDSDMRKGRQYAIFEASPKPGLSNYLSGVNGPINSFDILQLDESNNVRVSGTVSDYIQKTKIDNLDILVSGSVPPNPSELLNSEQMLKLIAEVNKIYDIVIIDGTPSSLVTDSLVLARFVDFSIIVTAYKITKKKDLEKIISGIQNVGGKVAGVVLNKLPVSSKKYQESYYYGGKRKR